MTKKQLERLLNTACEIITELEHNANPEQKQIIEDLFKEIITLDDPDA